MTGIADMFAELDGSARHHEQLELFVWRQRRARAEANRSYWQRWVAANPDKAREKRRRDSRAYRKRHPDKAAAARNRWRAKNPNAVRAMWRRSANKYVEKNKLDPAWREKKNKRNREWRERQKALAA